MLQISEHCSAGCSHCPFKQNKIFYKLEELKEKANNLSSPLLTITGGEPLEHPHFFEIIQWLSSKDMAFRVATGGHISMEQKITNLIDMPGFMGINLGTDVLSSRNCNQEQKVIWWQNLHLLQLKNIPWSLTLTLDDDLSLFPIVEEIQRKNFIPHFLMINEISGFSSKQDFINKLLEGPWQNLKYI